jgi:hypothetical protein
VERQVVNKASMRLAPSAAEPVEEDLSPVSKYNNEEQSTRWQVQEESNDALRGPK